MNSYWTVAVIFNQFIEKMHLIKVDTYFFIILNILYNNLKGLKEKIH